MLDNRFIKATQFLAIIKATQHARKLNVMCIRAVERLVCTAREATILEVALWDIEDALETAQLATWMYEPCQAARTGLDIDEARVQRRACEDVIARLSEACTDLLRQRREAYEAFTTARDREMAELIATLAVEVEIQRVSANSRLDSA